MSEIAKLSRQIWHAKTVTSEPVVPSWEVPDLRNLPPETKAEVEARVRRPPGEYLNDAMRRGVLELPRAGKLPIVGDALSNDMIRSQMGGLSDSISKIPPGTLRPLRQESLPSLEEVNQLAHDRIAALPPEQVQNVLAAGASRESTMFLRRMASEIAEVVNSSSSSDVLQLEEVFRSVQTPEGDTQVLGRTLINNEWYHFGTNSGTSPLQQASTWIAPSRLMASSNPAQHRDLHAGRVLNDVQSLFQGRWKPYIKGAGLGGRPHTVDIRHADKDGIKSVLATLDTITGTLKTIQSVTKGIQQGLEFLGMMGSLGDLGKYMSIFNQMKLPGSPGELITALITGKGINPNKPPAPPTADQTGSGKDGVLVTQGGAAAAAVGDTLLAKAEAEKTNAEHTERGSVDEKSDGDLVKPEGRPKGKPAGMWTYTDKTGKKHEIPIYVYEKGDPGTGNGEGYSGVDEDGPYIAVKKDTELNMDKTIFHEGDHLARDFSSHEYPGFDGEEGLDKRDDEIAAIDSEIEWIRQNRHRYPSQEDYERDLASTQRRRDILAECTPPMPPERDLLKKYPKSPPERVLACPPEERAAAEQRDEGYLDVMSPRHPPTPTPAPTSTPSSRVSLEDILSEIRKKEQERK